MTDKNLTELVECSVDDYIKELSKLELVDERIAKMLTYMKLQLSHGELHPLSRFWKMRKFCLDHFKEPIAVSQRLQLWKEYSTVIDEIVKLKQMMDEKSSFEREQIEEALLSIASDLEHVDQLISNESDIVIPKCPSIQKHAEFYRSTQKELSIYSSYAKRLNDLKKEILALDISYKKKQEILDKIHALADQVFPKKRDLLNSMSKTYIEHIQNFVKTYFSSSDFKQPIFQLKEQIKQLQNFAKVISLNVEAFSKTREELSRCWDTLKTFEKKQKKDKEERKEKTSKCFSEAKEKLAQLKAKKDSLSAKEFEKEASGLRNAISREDLMKFQRKQLLDELDEVVALDDKSLPEKSDEPSHLLANLEQLLSDAKDWDFEAIDAKLKNTLSDYDSTKIADQELIKVERVLHAIYEKLSEKLNEEINDRIDIEEISHQINDFREAVKKNIENYRKVLSCSNQSIEKAMVFNELLVQARHMLGSLEEHLSKHQTEA